MRAYDFAVVGAGVFGAWIAHFLSRSGRKVLLLDAYGPANSRASSGGETRVLRMGYGSDALYTRWSRSSLPLWQQLEADSGTQLFHRTGVLWLGEDGDSYTASTLETFARERIAYERLGATELRQRYPQLNFESASWAILEPESGLLMARKSVQLLAERLDREGVDFRHAAVHPPEVGRSLSRLTTLTGEHFSAGAYVFACGPWLLKLFPDLLAGRLFPTRQEVFFLGPPPGSADFRPPRMPVWLYHRHPYIPYALPDIESRGFKIAFDLHGEAIDPDLEQRLIPESSISQLRAFLSKHIPALAHAPIVETRVCQYENTWNGDFLADRHPAAENVWLAGGGSGHGFKHGPALGEYLAGQIFGTRPAEPRFSLSAKLSEQRRAVY